MAGTNPYITRPDVTLPTQKYKVTYHEQEHGETHVVEVDPADIPHSRTGQPGSLLSIALANHIEIEHTCGGVCACSTCHIIVTKGFASCSEPTEDEEDQLDEAPGLTVQSRLACQCVPDGTMDIEVVIPAWNRNAVKETPH